MSHFDAMIKTLNEQMNESEMLATKPIRQGFVNRSFQAIYAAYQAKQVSHDEYLKLINRLAAFCQGEYNDYIDLLAGAASMGMLEFAIQGEMPQFSPEAARKRRDTVTDMTGVKPVKPEER